MATPGTHDNGHRRRQLTKRVKAEEHTCALCDQHVDPSLRYLPNQHGRICPRADCAGCKPDPMRGEVDEDIPRSRGGSPYERSNCHLMHRKCNQWKSDRTLTEARAAFHGTKTGEAHHVTASPIW